MAQVKLYLDEDITPDELAYIVAILGEVVYLLFVYHEDECYFYR